MRGLFLLWALFPGAFRRIGTLIIWLVIAFMVYVLIHHSG